VVLVTSPQVSKVDPALVAVNQALRGYQGAWDDLVDSWLVVRIGNPDWVYKWRLQVGGVVAMAESMRQARVVQGCSFMDKHEISFGMVWFVVQFDFHVVDMHVTFEGRHAVKSCAMVCPFILPG
jgi:pantothenate kinase-related protein Tda10